MSTPEATIRLLIDLELQILSSFPLFQIICRHPDVIGLVPFNPKSWVVVVKDQPDNQKCPHLEAAVETFNDQIKPWSVSVLTFEEVKHRAKLEESL